MTPIEYRLYYDDRGQVITYTSENLPGLYLVISREQYAEANPNVTVKNNQIVKKSARLVTKLAKTQDHGTLVNKHDINIIDDGDKSEYWYSKIYDIS